MRVEPVDAARTRALRRAVLRPNLKPDDPLPGDDIGDAVHLAALDDDGTVSGTCFIYLAPCPWRPDDRPSWRLRSMATAPERRGNGIGAAMLDAAIGYIAAHGGGVLWLQARERAVSLYARGGLVGESGIFLDADQSIPHLRMWRRVEAAPPSQLSGAPDSSI